MKKKYLLNLLIEEKKVVEELEELIDDIMYKAEFHSYKGSTKDFMTAIIEQYVEKKNIYFKRRNINLIIEYEKHVKYNIVDLLDRDPVYHYSYYIIFYIYHIIPFNNKKLKLLNTKFNAKFILATAESKYILKEKMERQQLPKLIFKTVWAFVSCPEYKGENDDLYYIKYDDIVFVLDVDEYYKFKRLKFTPQLLEKCIVNYT